MQESGRLKKENAPSRTTVSIVEYSAVKLQNIFHVEQSLHLTSDRWDEFALK